MLKEESFWTRRLRRRSMLRGAAAAGVGVTALGLVACGKGSSTATPSPSAGDQSSLDPTKGKPGGTLIATNAGSWTILDPVAQAANGTNRMAGLSHSGLLEFRYGQAIVDPADASIQPDLARAMPEQPDATTFVFKLQPAKFHNGRAVTSEDVKYSYDRYARWEKSAFRIGWDWYDHAETPDAQTVIIKTKYPYADSLPAMAVPRDGFILAKEFEEGPDVNSRYMGSGPFIFVSMEPTTSMFFRKNPEYHRKPFPYFDELKVFVGLDPAKRVADYSARNVNLTWWFAVDDREQIKRNRPDAHFDVMMNAGDYMFLRCDKPPFNDVRIRQALSMTIDRKTIREATSRGEGFEDTQFLSTNTYWGARKVQDIPGAAKYWQFDPAEAKKLLAAAGLDKPLEPLWSHYDNTVVGQAFIDRITLTEAKWKDLGVANIKDTIITSAAYNSNILAAANYEGLSAGPNSIQALGGTTLRNRYGYTSDGSRGLNNVSWYNNPKASQLLDKQLTQFNLDERKSTFREIEQLLATEQPTIHWDNYPLSYFWDPNIKNARMPLIMGNFHFIKSWWFE